MNRPSFRSSLRLVGRTTCSVANSSLEMVSTSMDGTDSTTRHFSSYVELLQRNPWPQALHCFVDMPLTRDTRQAYAATINLLFCC